MKIIKESDQRFNRLQEMWSRLDNIELNRYTEGGGLQYIIPKELVINPIERWTGRGNLIKIDDKDDAQNFIITYRLGAILEETCDLTKQEYFDLVYLRINDTLKRPICNMCGSPMEFSGKILQGYRAGGGTGDNDDSKVPYFCCASCKSSWISYNNWKEDYFKMYDAICENGFSSLWKDDYGRMYQGTQNPIVAAKCARGRFLSTSDSRKSYLYIMRKGSILKIGISSYIPYDRTYYSLESVFEGELDSYKIFSGTDIEVANMEYDLKLMLNDYCESLSHEVFRITNRWHRIIKKIIKSYLKEETDTRIWFLDELIYGSQRLSKDY